MSAFTERGVFNEAMRAAAVYHADEGTSGWLLSEAQFDAILAAADTYRADGLRSLAAEFEAQAAATETHWALALGLREAASVARSRARGDEHAPEHGEPSRDMAQDGALGHQGAPKDAAPVSQDPGEPTEALRAADGAP